MADLSAVVAEIEGNWRSAECVGEEREVFYADLHNPETNARELLEGQCEVCPNLTDEQWREVLDRLRALFPNEEEECMLCGCARVSTLTGGIEKNMSLCAECDEVINDRLLKRMSPKTKEEEEDHAYGCDEDDCEDGTPHLGS
jgi:hypothetical protein